MSGLTLWICSLAIAAGLAIGVSRVGMAAIEDARATTAADAAALAGAANGEAAAQESALRNGATLHSVSVNGAVTTVVVRVGDATATAHAKRIVVTDR